MGIGVSEWIIIILISIFLIFGSKKLPEISRQIGRAAGEYNKAKQSISKEVKNISNLNSQNIDENSKNYKINKMGEGPISSEREKLEIIAKSLNIDFNDISDEELRIIITEKMKNNS